MGLNNVYKEVRINIDDFKLFELEDSLKKELSERQLIIMKYLRDGYHYTEICDLLRISLSTFYRERGEMMQKLKHILEECSDYQWSSDARSLFKGGENEP